MAVQVFDMANIGPSQRRLRMVLGIATLALGAAAAALLIAGGADLSWRLLLAIPFATGAMTYLEGRRGVCPLTAERGRRNLISLLSAGGERIADRGTVARLRQRGRRLSLGGTLIGLALTAAVMAIPGEVGR